MSLSGGESENVLRYKHKKKTSPLWRVLAILLLIVCGVLVFLYKDKLFDRSIKRAEDGTVSQEPYTYENGAGQQFALIGKKLAIASSAGMQILDDDGYLLSSRVFTMQSPSLDANGNACIFYDIGGTALKLWSNGELIDLDMEDEIISASINSSGYIAAATQASGYKGSVTVFNSRGEGIYKWYSGTGYVLDADLSPDNSKLAVLCIEASGSVVHILTIGDEEAEAPAVYLPRELAFKLSFTAGSSFCLLSESALSFFKTDGEQLQRADFGGAYLVDYCFTDSIQAVAVSRYVSKGSVTLSSYSDSGELLGSSEISFSPLDISAQGDRLFVLGQGVGYIFSKGMDLISEISLPAGYGDALLTPESSIILLSSYHGEKISAK